MNNQERLIDAVKTFSKSSQSTMDYMDFIQVVQRVTRQGCGMVWSHIKETIDGALYDCETLQDSGAVEEDWLCIYPTYDSYMFSVDQQLVFRCGLGHTHLPDFNWYDAYDEQVLPIDIVYEFMKEQYPIYN